MNQIFGFWGTPVVDMFATVSNFRLPQLSPIPEPRALAVDALSQDWQGRSMYMLRHFPAQQSYSETTGHTGSRGNSNSPLVDETPTSSLCGPSTVLSIPPRSIKVYRTCLGSVLNRAGKAKVVLHKNISDIIDSMELQRPRITPILSQWGLGIVLEALSKSPYEPL